MLPSEMKTISYKKQISIFLSILFLFLGCSQVSEISKYEYGKDRTNLTRLSESAYTNSLSVEKNEIIEDSLIILLNSDATFASKQFACRQLRVIGSEKSLPVLSDLLRDEKTSDIARYALEGIKGNSVDDALVEILNNSSRNIQIGVINTLGVRKSEKSVPAISNFLKSPDTDISNAASAALGKIANEECADQLISFYEKADGDLKNVILDSYLSCGNEMIKQNKLEKAKEIYIYVYDKSVPLHIKAAALSGIINSSSNKTEVITKRIINEPNELKFIPISKIRELPEQYDISDFAKVLPTLEPTNQIQLLSVFEDRSAKNAKPYILNYLKSDIEEVRIGAIRALANIGDETDVLTLASIASTQKGVESDYAKSSLDLIKSKKVEEINISDQDDDIKVELIRMAGARNIKSLFKDLLEYTKSENSKIRSEAFRSLAEISSDDNIPELTNLLLNIPFDNDRKKAERTISNIVQRSSNKNADFFLDKINNESDLENKCSLLFLLGFTNDDKAYNLLREELKNNNSKIKIAAINGLSNWSTAEPLEDLLNVLESDSDQTTNSAALKGFTNFIEMKNDLPDDKKIELYKKALNYSKTGNERNIALDGIGHIDSFESLEIFKSYTNQPDVKETVDDGINRISWHMYEKDPEKVIEYVSNFMNQIKDDKFQSKSQELLDTIDRFIQKRDSEEN
jgi:HEAT repeat protein